MRHVPVCSTENILFPFIYMTKSNDLLEQMRRNPRGDWTIGDVEKLCRRTEITCTPPSGGGSHYKVSAELPNVILTIPARRPIKLVYIRQLVSFVDAVLELRVQQEQPT